MWWAKRLSNTLRGLTYGGQILPQHAWKLFLLDHTDEFAFSSIFWSDFELSSPYSRGDNVLWSILSLHRTPEHWGYSLFSKKLHRRFWYCYQYQILFDWRCSKSCRRRPEDLLSICNYKSVVTILTRSTSLQLAKVAPGSSAPICSISKPNASISMKSFPDISVYIREQNMIQWLKLKHNTFFGLIFRDKLRVLCCLRFFY